MGSFSKSLIGKSKLFRKVTICIIVTLLSFARYCIFDASAHGAIFDHHLVSSPIVIRIDTIDTTLKIGFKPAKPPKGSYTLEVNDAPFNELDEFKDVAEVPEVGHSSHEET